MIKIINSITISANVQSVFDLTRNIKLHKQSLLQSVEKRIEGKCNGLIDLNDQIYWESNIFYLKQSYTSKITEFNAPNYFTDELQSGAFSRFKHSHQFTSNANRTIMDDIIELESPYSFLGKVLDRIILKPYLKNILQKRALYIKKVAESRS